jgi:hypothetical protein
MNNSTDHAELPLARKRQFTIRGILFATALVAIAAAGFGGLVRSGEDTPTVFVLFVIAAPLALMLILSLGRAIERLIVMRRKQRENRSDS